MSDETIRALVAANPGQGTFEEYRLVRECISSRAPCNLLVFGVGRDSALWLDANEGGVTVFLESDAVWIATVRNDHPGIVAWPVAWRGRRFLWPLLRTLRRGAKATFGVDPTRTLTMGRLPPAVEETCWHVILVDAPRGLRWHHRGRVGSIHTAARLGRRGQAVHDCHRAVERQCCDEFIGADRLVAQVGSMRHYRFD